MIPNETVTNKTASSADFKNKGACDAASEGSLEEIDLLVVLAEDASDDSFYFDDDGLDMLQNHDHHGSQNSCLHRAMNSFSDIVNNVLHHSFRGADDTDTLPSDKQTNPVLDDKQWKDQTDEPTTQEAGKCEKVVLSPNTIPFAFCS